MISLAVELLSGQINKIFGKIYIVVAVSERFKLKLSGEHRLDFFHALVVESEHLKVEPAFQRVLFNELYGLFEVSRADGDTVSQSFHAVAVIVIGAVF